jgi:hypothetical protein
MNVLLTNQSKKELSLLPKEVSLKFLKYFEILKIK